MSGPVHGEREHPITGTHSLCRRWPAQPRAVGCAPMQPTAEQDPSAGDLREYLRVAARRKRTIVFAVLLVTGVVIASIAFQSPEYESTASILLKPTATAALLDPTANLSANPALDVQTQIQVVKSQPVKDAVRADLGATPSIAVASVGQTAVISITARSTDPPTAAVVANAYANDYVAYRRRQDLNDALDAETQIQTRIGALQREVDSLNQQIKNAAPKDQTAVAATVTPQVDSLLQQESTFKQQLGQLQVGASVQAGGVQVVNSAATSTSPVSPRPARDLILAVAAGLMLGIGAAFALEYLDDTVKSREELDRLVHYRVPTAAVIPRLRHWKSKDGPVVVSITDSRSPTAESYRTLRTAIQFASLDRPLHILQVTSPSAGDGKTTTIANLGVALAQTGKRVIIVCCDLRKPRLHDFFQLDNTVGFTSVVLGELSTQSALQTVPSVPGLRILASGPLPHNPSELLASQRTGEVLTALLAEADIVLVDSPPTLPVTDSSVIAGRVDGTLLIVMAGKTTRRHVTQAAELLGQVGAPLLGAILNGVSPGTHGSSYYYDYYQRDGGPTRRWGFATDPGNRMASGRKVRPPLVPEGDRG